MKTIRTANGLKAEHLTGGYWLIYTDTDRRDLIKVTGGYEIGAVNFEMWGRFFGPPDPSFIPVAHAVRYYERSISKPSWHISDEGQFWDNHIPYAKDLKEMLTVRAENHAAKEA